VQENRVSYGKVVNIAEDGEITVFDGTFNYPDGFKGATGQGHVTQAQRDMIAQQEMESARQLTAEQFQNAMAVQEYEADLQRQRDERQAATNKELAQMGYGFDAQQSAAQRQLQRDLAAQQNLPPIAPAF